MIRYITEKDFVPEYVYQSQRGKNEIERGLYQIVYGVLLNQMNYNCIYDLIVRISQEQKFVVVKRFMLKTWRKEVDEIIKKLTVLDIKDKDVIVFNPFTHYYHNVPYTKNRFELVIDIIDEIMVNGDAQMEISKKPQYDYPIDCFEEFIGNYRLEFEKQLLKENSDKIEYYRELIFDEMIRRGMKTLIKAPFWEQDPQTGEFHKVVREITISPSIYYKQPQRLFELGNYFEEYKLLKIKFEKDSEEENDGKSGNGSDRKVNAKEMAGIIYFMLKETFQDTFEKGDKKKLVEFVNCLLDLIVPDPERKKDTARNYIDAFKRIPKEYQSQRFYSIVKDTLKQYNFGIPEAIKEATEITKKHIKVY